jgi:DNA-binding MurR/RpiR family transcriptional regulator
MEMGSFSNLLLSEFALMPPKLQVVAQYVLNYPEDVALVSMREQARRVGVSHSTMARLANWLGLEGYEEIREACAAVLRDCRKSWSPPEALVDQAGGLTADVLVDAIAMDVSALAERASAGQLARMATRFAQARRVFCLGLEPAGIIAHHFHRAIGQLGREAYLVNSEDKRSIDLVRRGGAGDALLVIGPGRSAATVLGLVQHLTRRGVAVAAITDSTVSPLVLHSQYWVVVKTGQRSHFSSMVTILTAAEILAALIGPDHLSGNAFPHEARAKASTA